MNGSFRVSARHAGFQLIECLTVVAVIGIAAAISLPRLASYVHAGRLKREAAELGATIERLLIQSQRERRAIELVLGPGYYLAQRADTDRLNDDRAGVLEFHTVRAPVTLRVRDGQKLRLLPQGVTSPTSILILDGAARCQISVALRGRVTVGC